MGARIFGIGVSVVVAVVVVASLIWVFQIDHYDNFRSVTSEDVRYTRDECPVVTGLKTLHPQLGITRTFMSGSERTTDGVRECNVQIKNESERGVEDHWISFDVASMIGEVKNYYNSDDLTVTATKLVSVSENTEFDYRTNTTLPLWDYEGPLYTVFEVQFMYLDGVFMVRFLASNSYSEKPLTVFSDGTIVVLSERSEKKIDDLTTNSSETTNEEILIYP